MRTGQWIQKIENGLRQLEQLKREADQDDQVEVVIAAGSAIVTVENLRDELHRASGVPVIR